jgi:N-acetylmuramoyl-L-alanine amidase
LILRVLLTLVAAVLSLLALFSPALAQESTSPVALPNVIDLRMTATEDRARLVIDLAARTEFSFVSMSEPDRLAVDVRAGTFSVPEPEGESDAGGLVSSYVVEQVAGDRVRTTLSLAGPAQVQQAYVLDAFNGQPARLVVDIIPADAAVFAANVESDRAVSDAAAAKSAESTPAGGS